MSKTKQNLYEGMYILSATLSEDARKKAIEKIPSPLPGKEEQGRIRRTDEEIAKDRIDAVKKILDAPPDPVLIPLVKMLFNTWPYSVISSIRYDDLMKVAEKSLPLKDEEATAVAIPLTQLKNYYLPGINPIWFAWANLASAVYSIMAIRLTTLSELRAAIKARDKTEHPEGAILKDVCKCSPPPMSANIENGVCMKCKKPIKK